MNSARQVSGWVLAALAALALLVGVLRRERHETRGRWSTLRVGNPAIGARLFEAKGCVHCHATGGEAPGAAPGAVAAAHASGSGPERLVTAMWNHAPRMWERMQVQQLEYPTLDNEETAHVLAYLHTLGFVDEPGDAGRGGELFRTRGCARCHRVGAAGRVEAPDLAQSAGVTTPVGWMRAIWNHGSVADTSAAPPSFDAGDMGDLLAFVRAGRAPGLDGTLLDADPDRGWRLFESKSCTACHSVRDEAGRVGPELGPSRELPATIFELAGSMWNHSAVLRNAMRERGIEPAKLGDREMADLVAFLYSFRYAEPGGSPKLGEVLFTARGCARCHGAGARGSDGTRDLRGRGKNFNTVTLAAALWRHGPRMYAQARDHGLDWPMLGEGDVGDLMAFLNTSPEGGP